MHRLTTFQSTPPARGATEETSRGSAVGKISIHAPREGGDDPRNNMVELLEKISIHAPREGGDYEGNWLQCVHYNFNPRPPRGGRRNRNANNIYNALFQSTPPARGATEALPVIQPEPIYFNPRPPRGGRLQLLRSCVDYLNISIHAPREGGDFGVVLLSGRKF